MTFQRVAINRETGRERLHEMTAVEYTEWVMRAQARGYIASEIKNGMRFVATNDKEKNDFKVYFAP